MEYVFIEDSKFIFNTNFEGNPDKDKYRSAQRKGNVRLTEEQAKDLIAKGYNVKKTKPKEGYEDEYEPQYYISVKMKWKSEGAKSDPRVFLISGDNSVRLDANSVRMIDDIWVEKVNIKANPYVNKNDGRISLYINVMYVWQNIDEDPWANKYGTVDAVEPDDDEIPFDVE